MAQRDHLKSQRQQAESRSSQCLGMRDVITLKCKRESQLNEREVAALRDIGRSHNERCIAP